MLLFPKYKLFINVRNEKILTKKITQINYKKMSVKKHTDEAKKKISESQKKRYQNMSAERKKEISDKIKKRWKEIQRAMYLLSFEKD